MQGQQQEQQLDPQLETQVSNPQDVRDLHRYGYRQVMRRSMGAFASFAVAYSMISITNAIYFLFPNVFQSIGGIGIWLWLPIAAGIFMIVLVYGHLAARMPVTGYAYQWNSRLLSSHYGWFTGWTAFLAFIAGTASIGTAFATVFAPDVWAKPTQGDIVLLAGVIIAVTTVINVASIRTVNAVNNAGVVFEFVGSILAAALLFVGALFFWHHTEGLKVLTQVGAAGGGKATGYGLALAALLPIYTLLGWEGSADLAEETNDPRVVTPHAMIRANYISVIASLFMSFLGKPQGADQETPGRGLRA